MSQLLTGSIMDRMRHGLPAVAEPVRPAAPPDGRLLPASFPPPSPCPQCSCPIRWFDAYGQHHCGGCVPPRVPAMARRRVMVAHGSDGRPVWLDFDSELECRASPEPGEPHAAATPFPQDGRSPAPPAPGGAGGVRVPLAIVDLPLATIFYFTRPTEPCPGGGNFWSEFLAKPSSEPASEKISQPKNSAA